jgi:hypothetical protein
MHRLESAAFVSNELIGFIRLSSTEHNDVLVRQDRQHRPVTFGEERTDDSNTPQPLGTRAFPDGTTSRVTAILVIGREV